MTMFSTVISGDRLVQHLTDPNWIVIDCRFVLSDPAAGERSYQQSHIPYALYAHLERDLSGQIKTDTGRHPLPDREELTAKLGVWGVGRDSQVVVYDDVNGAMAARLWWLLRWLGHAGVALLDGGWTQWLKEGLPVSLETYSGDQVSFTPGPPLLNYLSTSELQEGLRDKTIRLLDARTAERFRGEVEPIDPIAGHIPGAINRPFQLNLAADGRFLSAKELLRQFTSQLEVISPYQVVNMCGSGVTACHNIVAMEIAGLNGSRLYAGSWSEWIRNPDNPVAKGTM